MYDSDSRNNNIHDSIRKMINFDDMYMQNGALYQ